MGGFIYGLATNEINKQVLADTELNKVLGDNPTTRQTNMLPGGGKGLLIAGQGTDSKHLLYKPEEQDWQKALNGKYWIGWYVNAMPGPIELARKEQIDGHQVFLGDGKKWQIPLARAFPAGTALPQALIMGKDGVLKAELIPRFIEFSKKAEKYWTDFLIIIGVAEGKPATTMEQAWEMAVEALNINYHISTDEINIMKLLNTNNIREVCKAIIDFEAVEEFINKSVSQKKTAIAEEQSSNSGSAAG
jgi:hypothetical protein